MNSTISGVTCAAIFLIGTVSACSGGGETSQPAPSTVAPPSTPPPASSANVMSETDIIYGSGLVQNGAVNLLLDIYQPEGDCTDPRPFVIGIHGGGFTSGSKSSANWVDNMEAVAAAGFVGISIDYRLVGDNPVVSAEFQPIADDLQDEADRLALTDTQRSVLNAAAAAFEDSSAALAWARDNASARCLDIDRFAIWGSSAGAITGLHISHGLDDYFIDRPKPLVVIDYWGRLLLDGLVDADGPPFMIIHGTADQSQIYEETALVLAAEADAVGLPYSFYTIEGGPHGFSSVNPNRVEINGETPLTVTIEFISDHLLGETPNYEVQTIVPN
ncbi:MAG: alpha/beta hydrolase [Pseudomonadota bacterium]